MPTNYDFCGWATRNDIKCSDGRTIRKDAFKDNDGMTVPLVWNHQHNEPYNVLGHALLENREDGVYTYGYLNNTESGKNARELLKNGDIRAMSIYANRLTQTGGNVLHGMIREVSLVLSPANPGATIEAVLVHSDDYDDGEEDLLIVNHDVSWEMAHADEPSAKKEAEDEKKDPFEGLTPEQIEELKKKLKAEDEKKPEADEGKKAEEKKEESKKDESDDKKPEADEGKEEKKSETSENKEAKPAEDGKSDGDASHADNDEEALAMADNAKEKTVQDVFDEFTEEQKNVVYALIGAALEQAKNGGNEEMKQNGFESNGQNNAAPEQEVLSHAEMEEIMNDAQELGSLKKAVLQHGITNIDLLFPDYKNYTDKPTFIDRPQGWVKEVMDGVGKTPFTRVKSMFADITGEEARARGYIKGDQKVDEVFSLLKRETSPQTVYKKQSLDRDDIIDITDFDVVAWLRREMRGKLDEELARAILVGDGRAASAQDKIKEANIRPIWSDDPALFVVRANVTADNDAAKTAKNFIKAAVKARKDYKGSGNPALYVSEELLTECLLLEDSIGRPLYDSEAKLATAMRVSKIISVPVMENLSRSDDAGEHKLMGIIVNLNDYNVGCDKGGQVSMFDDFDIDYNKQKYLIETRISGALVVPFSAIVLESLENPQ